ncbi:MAG: hypothetical protein KatS3mg114_0540 [Planctomycetaceae bacterium]|nr:MAG: hypothetical protein KatS3mg114_0540 [Planctomycetaceae bacterium]
MWPSWQVYLSELMYKAPVTVVTSVLSFLIYISLHA